MNDIHMCVCVYVCIQRLENRVELSDRNTSSVRRSLETNNNNKIREKNSEYYIKGTN